VIEDNDADVFLIREALETAGIDADLTVIEDGDAAIRYFEQADASDAVACPDLILIDINLPKRHGGEVLEYMRATRRCAGLDVLVVTSSDSARDRQMMASLGASRYFRKPSDYDEFMTLGEEVRSLLPPR